MLVMVVFFIAFRWIHLSTPLIRLFLLVLILLLMPTLNFLPVWFALSLLRFRLPSRLPMMFILWMVAMMVVIIPNRRQLNSLQNTWPYGYSMPIAVRYTQGAFSRSGWLWPVDAKGEPLKATSYMAVGFYVAKYVNKKSDMDLAAKG